MTQTDRPIVKTEIDGIEYQAVQMGAERALELIFRLGQALGPAIDQLGPVFAQYGRLGDIEVSAIAPALGKLLGSLTPDATRAIIREGLFLEAWALITADGKTKRVELSSRQNIDNHFVGALDRYLKVIAWSVKVHLSSFSSVLGNLTPLLGALKKG